MKASSLLFFILGFSVVAHPQSPDPAMTFITAGLNAMGGAQKLHDLAGIHLVASVVRNELEQSERPEGPYILETGQVEEWRDFRAAAWKKRSKAHVSMQPEFIVEAVVDEGAASLSYDGHPAPASGQQLQDAAEALAISPERVLITAAASADLRSLPDSVLQGVTHHAIAFTWNRRLIRVYLNSDTHLPTEVEWTCAYPYGVFWSIWGDVNTRIYYSFWWLQDGIHYPLQADIFRDGLHDQTLTITKLEFNTSFSPSTFSITPETRTAFTSRAGKTIDDRAPGQAVTELAPGILFIPGAWNTTIIRQEDGIVILEAPISSGYSAKVIQLAKTKFPGIPIKAVITTSDSWPHIGGVREYVAEGIPAYVLDRTVPLIDRFLYAPRIEFPDHLSQKPTPPVLLPVSGKTVVGSGPNRIEIYPIHGETSERQMMVYFPEQKLLYGSDPFQELEERELFYPQTVSELSDAVAREQLTVDRFFMMHIGPTPWLRVRQTLEPL
ncbi:MBL fold metallo-hydrolase [Occallatibacter riparius]|uniref:MBL fold metallo-hydrolase n=1 Tax=Occallatibacter riparius TaxID=1002689 RepID=A0A9J7BJT9_9BACT|nr:hypothetical protein [Occallatibacter riparius]UWZ82811.1 hypothetical protein MOP44_19855 [Occallatibacter riparius]